MAYFDPALGRAAALAFAPHAPHRLAPIERQVVLLSRRDGFASVFPRKGLRARLRRLFGLGTANPLADPRLEALRRYAVLLRHGGDRLAAEARAALTQAGYGEAQVAQVRWLIAREPRRPNPVPSLLLAAIVTACALGAAVLALQATDDRTIALIAGLLTFVTIAPLAVSRRRR